ncbi:MAG: hypothetical protein IJ639_03640 [Ruminococcus sp.]|nr:hypothetical protein [Ruminococcus sp.]
MSSIYNGVIYQPITVDVSQPNEFAPLLVKQKDAYTRGYDVTLTDNGAALTIPTENTTVWLNCRNQTDPDKRASATGTINSDGTVSVIVPAAVMDVAGYIQCDISVITAVGTDTHILKSTLFYLNCEAAANPNGTTSAAEDSILAGIAAGTIIPPAGPYVPKTRTIADIDLCDDITAEELIAALGIDGSGVIIIDAETSADWNDEIPTDFEGEEGNVAFYDGKLWLLYQITKNAGHTYYFWESLVDYADFEAALQGKEDTGNKTNAITSENKNSTTKFPTLKAVADYVDRIVGDVETLLTDV